MHLLHVIDTVSLYQGFITPCRVQNFFTVRISKSKGRYIKDVVKVALVMSSNYLDINLNYRQVECPVGLCVYIVTL